MPRLRDAIRQINYGSAFLQGSDERTNLRK